MIEDTKKAICKALEMIDDDCCAFRNATKLKRAIAVSGNVVVCVAEYPNKFDVVGCTVENLAESINVSYVLDNLHKQDDITFRVETDELPELLWHNGHFGMVTNYISLLNVSSYSKTDDKEYDDIKDILVKRLQKRLQESETA